MPVDNNVFDAEWELAFAWRRERLVICWSSQKTKDLYDFRCKKNSTSLIEFKIACGDIGLSLLISRAYIHIIGIHMRINVSNKLAVFLTREYVSRLSKHMRLNYGWYCVYDGLCVKVNNVYVPSRSRTLSCSGTGQLCCPVPEPAALFWNRLPHSRAGQIR